MKRTLILVSALVLVLVSACAQPTEEPGSGATPPAGTPLTIFAAASLTDVMTTIGTAFQREASIPTTFSFAGSADLVAQVSAGAPADVLATADEATMARARNAGVVTVEPTVFATNTLTIAVAPGNPLGITGLADLARPGRTVVICAPQVPCGATTAAVAADAGVTLTSVSEENSVTDVLGKVTSGEADAGIVWSTDIARAKGQATGIDFPEAANRPSSYYIAPVASSTRGEGAHRFIDYVTGPAGQQVLVDAGFRSP
jgi:molybdate transport system substrate-binding protein